MSELSTVSGAVQRAADIVRKHVQERAHTCPCCGQVIVPAVELAHLSPMEQRVFDIVRTRMPHGISRTRLFDHLYGGDPNGGPAHINTVSVIVCNLNKKLKPYGIRVNCPQRGWWASAYRIIALQEQS
jgi:hypothetical protein